MCNKDYPGIEKFKKRINLIKYFSLNSNIFEKLNYLRKNLVLKFFFYLPIKIVLLTLNYFFLTIYYFFKYYFFFKKYKFDRLVVVNGGYPASLILRVSLLSWRASTNKKSILNIHNFSLPYRVPFGIFEYFLDYLIMKSVSKIILCSKSCLSNFKKRSIFLKHQDISFIYNGVDQKKLSKIEKIKNSVGVFASLEIRKGHIYLLDIIKLLIKKNSKIKFFFYGEGEKWEEDLIKKKIIKLKLENNVTLMGFVDNNSYHMQKMEIIAIPSLEYESFGYVGVEAMSCKVPIVANKIGGLAEVLKNVPSAKLIQLGNKKKFAKEILNFFLASKSEINQNLSKSYEIFKKKYNKSTMQKNYFKKIL